jgi:hypothetical protein
LLKKKLKELFILLCINDIQIIINKLINKNKNKDMFNELYFNFNEDEEDHICLFIKLTYNKPKKKKFTRQNSGKVAISI